MMYVIEPTDLVHGKEWKRHKYLRKVMTNKGVRYVYSKPTGKKKKTVTNANSKLQYSPNVRTMDYLSYDHRIKDPYHIFDGIHEADKILMEPINYSRRGASWGGVDPARGTAYYTAIRSKVDKQKLNLAYVNSKKQSDYTPSQSSKAASSRHYTPDEKKKK